MIIHLDTDTLPEILKNWWINHLSLLSLKDMIWIKNKPLLVYIILQNVWEWKLMQFLRQFDSSSMLQSEFCWQIFR